MPVFRVVCVALASLLVAQQAPPTFRSQTSLVPIDVRVLDRDGRPILGLTAADFTIREDNRPQAIGHFAAITLSKDPPPADAAPVRRSATAESAPLVPQTRRLFLISLGRGRLQYPSRGVDGAIKFVAERLLPQDQVAVMAYNRATDFTTDRAQTIALLERFKVAHEAIEAKLSQYFTGWAATYKGAEIPDALQRDIDAIFKGGARELPPGRVGDAPQISRDDRRAIDDMERAALLRARQDAGVPISEFDKAAIAETGASGVTLAEYVETNRQTMQDLGRLYAGLDYLRYIDGEKHIIFIAVNGLTLPRLESDLGFAAAANHARVAVSVVQTGGLKPTMRPMSSAPGIVDPLLMADITRGEPLNQRFVVASMYQMSELTGGQASVYDYADNALERIAVATSAGYLLGYYPTSPQFDGKFRKIRVTVNRPGATVLYRHGYFAEPPRTPIDRRRDLTYNRIASAATYPQEIRDLKFSLKTTDVRVSGRPADLVVDLAIDASTVSFTLEGGLQRAALDVAVFCQDINGDPVGDLWEKVDLKLSDATYQRMMKDGIVYSGRVVPTRVVKFVKIVVYDYASDRVGSMARQIR